MDTRLAYDVGGYDGADTSHYLSLGYKVICIEAAPKLAAQISTRFQREISEGQCKVLNIAIGTNNGNAPFYLSSNAIWNSFDRSMAARNGRMVTEISVPTRTFESILAEHGVPYFLKIDIEGADYACLKALGEDLPQYLSFEAARDSFDMLLMLADRGYSRFSLIRQDTFEPIMVPFAGTMSHVRWSARQVLRLTLRKYRRLHEALTHLGLPKMMLRNAARSGEKRVHSAGPTPMERQYGWHSTEEFMYLWTSVIYSGMIDSLWYDVHAARD
jgi:FkbM family methyltransferase